MKIIKHILTVLFLVSSFSIFSHERGMQPVQIKIGGKITELYAGSNALVIWISDYANGLPSLPGVAYKTINGDVDNNYYLTGTELGVYLQDKMIDYSDGMYHPHYGKIRKIKPKMVLVHGGTFQMGCNAGEQNEKPVHSVTIHSFYMGKYEVTVGQFKQFIDKTSYQTDADKKGGSYIWTGRTWEMKAGMNWKCDAEGKIRQVNEYKQPVTNVSWNDAMEYCKWLSQKTGKNYRLPTEAEWEYAAGNGSKHTKYSWGNSEPYGENGGNMPDRSAKQKFNDMTVWSHYNDGFIFTAPVGSFKPNEFGLYDITGNVWEWCSDWYDEGYYMSSPSNDPKGPSMGSSRVQRGGSWVCRPEYQRVANRNFDDPSFRHSDVGFRLARTE
jgi:formylglycine-generating enzyme required for sulfatase activity